MRANGPTGRRSILLPPGAGFLQPPPFLSPVVSPEALSKGEGAPAPPVNSKGRHTMRMRNLLPCVAFLLVTQTAQAQWSHLSLTLLPVPCRNVDTRIGEGVLQDNEIYIFSVDPLFSDFQGGAAGCGVPPGAAAVKLLIKGQSQLFDGGYFRVFNASASALGTYSHLQLQDPLQFVGAEFAIPIDGNMLVAIHTLKSAHAVVDIAGYYTAN